MKFTNQGMVNSLMYFKDGVFDLDKCLAQTTRLKDVGTDLQDMYEDGFTELELDTYLKKLGDELKTALTIASQWKNRPQT